jgi:chromosome segregation ATPase
MTDPLTAQLTAIKLAEIAHEIEELESSRLSILQRIERLRSLLMAAGNRTTTARASTDFLTEHMTDVAIAQVRLLEAEVREIASGLDHLGRESNSAAFETNSLEDTFNDVEEEIERLSMVVLSGEVKSSRGH